MPGTFRPNSRHNYYARPDQYAKRGPDGLIPLGKDVPPPGHSEFYGWHEGRFYGLRVTDPAQLLTFRREGRWFDEYGTEYPRWDESGRPLRPEFTSYGITYHCDEWHGEHGPWAVNQAKVFATFGAIYLSVPILALIGFLILYFAL